MQPLEYELRIVNASPFAYPFIEAVVNIPENDGVRCTEQSVNMSLCPPYGILGTARDYVQIPRHIRDRSTVSVYLRLSRTVFDKA